MRATRKKEKIMSKLLIENPELEKVLLKFALNDKLQTFEQIRDNLTLSIICALDDLESKGLIEVHQDSLSQAMPKLFPTQCLYRKKKQI